MALSHKTQNEIAGSKNENPHEKWVDYRNQNLQDNSRKAVFGASCGRVFRESARAAREMVAQLGRDSRRSRSRIAEAAAMAEER